MSIWHSALDLFGDIQEMLLLLLPLLNSSAVKNILSPFAKDKSSSTKEDTVNCPICQVDPAIPFIALPCQHRYGIFLCTSAKILDQNRVLNSLPQICSIITNSTRSYVISHDCI